MKTFPKVATWLWPSVLVCAAVGCGSSARSGGVDPNVAADEDAPAEPRDDATRPSDDDAPASSGDASSPGSDAPDAPTASPEVASSDAASSDTAATSSDAGPATDTASEPDTTAADATPPPADVGPTPGAIVACRAMPSPSGAVVSSPPLIAHWEKPADPNIVVLTFDDGPDDAGVTNRVLDILKTEGIHAAFFVNTRNGTTLTTSTTAQKTLARIIAEGHELGNHTAHHPDLATLSASDVELELATVESDVASIAGVLPCAPTWSLTRAPFGSPYLSGTKEQLDTVSHVMGKHGVHVGWSIESLDWDCQGKPGCADEWKNRVLGRIDLGRRGPILMHSTVLETADALPSLIAELRKRGVTFGSVEALVLAKYGKSSAQLTVDYRASAP